MTEPREYTQRPWIDPRGFQARRREAIRFDPQSATTNAKRSSVVVLDDSMLEEIETTYNVVTVYEVYEVPGDELTARSCFTKHRTKGRIVVFIEYVDPYGQAVQIELPGEVIERIQDQRKKLVSENRSRQGKGRTIARRIVKAGGE